LTIIFIDALMISEHNHELFALYRYSISWRFSGQIIST
jgi:hypothetical protein